MKELLEIAVKATIEASFEVLKQYHSNFKVQLKEDNSPVTSADLAANEILTSYLKNTQYPILSEEGEFYTHKERQEFEGYWCLDPIDGTQDFVNKTDEFCICTGYISENTSKLGVLSAPALGWFYFAADGIGSFKFNEDFKQLKNFMNMSHLDELIDYSKPLPAHTLGSSYTFLTSRFHRDKETDEYIQKLKSEKSNFKLKTMGSAIKLGMMAERSANEYTRFRSVNFWDIAAGHAVAKYAGLLVKDPNTGEEINYSDEQMRVNGYSMKW